jgi:hypothetical protein
VIHFLTTVIREAGTVITAGIGAAASLYVASVWWRTKALVPTATAILMAGVVVWAVANVDVLGAQVDADSANWIVAPPAAPGAGG